MKAIDVKRISKFLVSGLAAVLTELIVFIFIMSQSDVLIVGHAISFGCGLLVSFSLNRTWVFRSTGNKNKQFAVYLFIALVNLILSSVLIVSIVDVLGVDSLLAKFVTMGLVATWNYILFSRVVFKN